MDGIDDGNSVPLEGFDHDGESLQNQWQRRARSIWKTERDEISPGTQLNPGKQTARRSLRNCQTVVKL
jgi:hypothetical protein